MINVVEVPDPASVRDAFELGLILPVPAPEKNCLVTEPRDGDRVQRLTATAVDFKHGGRTAYRSRKIKIDLFITDARFALACSKFDKGGGWNFWGGGSALALDVAFNSVSKARAALRSRGKMLVGQLRYPWVHRVGSSSKKGRASGDQLALDASAGPNGAMRLILTLPKNIEAAFVASEIAQRAARFRLASEEVDGAVRGTLEALTSAAPLLADSPDSAEFRFFDLPRPKIVGEASARLAPRGMGAGA